VSKKVRSDVSLQRVSQSVINALIGQYSSAPFNDELNTLLESAYKERSLSEATRKLVHQLFGDKGLVVIDADRKDLKGLATHLWSKELETGFSAIRGRQNKMLG
jgi:uncharacterized protein YllA (UPF0747 family)